MSVSLDEIISHAGYDIKNNIDDARWLLAQKDEFEELLEIAEQTVDDYDEYEEYLDETPAEEEPMDFETWKEFNKLNTTKILCCRLKTLTATNVP